MINKYPDILPFEFNRVILGRPKEAWLFETRSDNSSCSVSYQDESPDSSPVNFPMISKIKSQDIISSKTMSDNKGGFSHADYINASYINTCLD